jgi:hypothetical protein
MQPNSQLDPQALNLAKAIRRAETGSSSDPYNTRGKSGEFGAYQFMPDTWKQWAGQYLQDANAPYSIENQNKVAYSRIKELKDQGLNPAQIASMWNSGKAEAYKQDYRGVNKQGVEYDVPEYVKKVSQYYNELKMGGQAAPVGPTQFQTTVPRPEEGGVLSQLGTAKVEPPKPPSQLETRLSQGSEALSKLSQGVAEGDLSRIASGVIQTGGAAAGGALDLVNAGLNAATFGAYDASMDFIGKKVIAPLFKSVGGEKIIKEWEQFATENPEAAKNIGALGNIVSVIPVFKVIRLGVGAAKGVVATGVAKTGFTKTVEETAKQELRQAGATAPSKAGEVLSPRVIKGQKTDPIDTIVDKDYLPDVVPDANGIPRYQASTAIRKLDNDLDLDEKLLQQSLEAASQKGLVGYVPIASLRIEADNLFKKAFADRGQVDTAIKKANKIFDDYNKYKGDLVPLTELNNMKRGIREAVNFNSPKLGADVRYQLGQLFMDKIEDVAQKQGLKDIVKINRDMAEKIRAKEALEFLDQRSVVERPGFRTMLGRKSGDVGTIAGEAAGQSMGLPGVGAVIGRSMTNRAIGGSGKSVIGKLRSKRTRKRPSRLQTGAALAALLPSSNQEDQSEQR